MRVDMRIRAILTVLIMCLPVHALASNESCGLVLENVPVGATIRVSAFWKGDDPDEAIEDEGYVFQAIEGGNDATLSIWRQPFLTYTFNFTAIGPRVVIQGTKDPMSTTHSEGLETEGCEITATINSLPPWVKDYARISFPFLTIGTAGLGTLAVVYPPAKIASAGVGFTTLVAKLLTDDPIDCTSHALVVPVFTTPPSIDDTNDAVATIANRIALNGSRTFAIAKAAVANANRANCPDFTGKQKAALFARAQNQGQRIGNHLARLQKQLTNFAAQTEQAGVVVDEFRDVTMRIEDWLANFTDPKFTDPKVDAPFLQVLTPDELVDLKHGMFGVALINFHAQTHLYPDLWPADGVRSMFPALSQWSASLIAKEVGQ